MSGSIPGQPNNRWRAWCNDHPIGSLALVGVIATQLGTYFGYVFPAVGLPTLPWPMYNGALALGISGPNWNGYFDENWAETLNHASGMFFAGQALHFVNGIVFAILFGLIARHSLPFNKDTNGGNISKGLLYGVIMNIYFWPFMVGGGDTAYEPGVGFLQAAWRYLLFYLTTSFVWDIARAVGNGLLIAILGLPTVEWNCG